MGHAESEQTGLPGFSWRQSDTIACADGNTRRIESGSFPLAHGISGRMGLLRGYGNAIVPLLAAEFVSAWMDCSNTEVSEGATTR
jgi:DNA (cytosine-5)-methyltransferase 1